MTGAPPAGGPGPQRWLPPAVCAHLARTAIGAKTNAAGRARPPEALGRSPYVSGERAFCLATSARASTIMILFMTNVGRPDPAEYAPYFAKYTSNVTEDDVLAALEAQMRDTAALLARLDDAKASYRYAPEKWSVKEVVGHFIDAERVFAYRALAVARGEQASLPSFDENDYVRNADFDARSIGELASEYAAARA